MSANENLRAYNCVAELASAATQYELFTVATASKWIGGVVPFTSLVGCLGFSFQMRGAIDLRFAFETGKVATPTEPYLTLKSGAVFNAPEKLCLSGITTIYFAAASGSNNVVELIIWK